MLARECIFSWEKGFVCTGPNPTPPIGMVGRRIERSRFDFEHETIDGVDVYVAGEINAKDVLNSVPSNKDGSD